MRHLLLLLFFASGAACGGSAQAVAPTHMRPGFAPIDSAA